MLLTKDKHMMVMINSAREIAEMIAPYTADQLSFALVLHSEDQNAMKLLRWYERLLMLCKMDFERYIKIKGEEHLKIAAFIHENQLYHQWAELIPFIVLNSDTSAYTNVPLVALSSEVGDTWLTLTIDRNANITGVTRDGKSFIEVPNPYYGMTDNLTILAKKLHDNKISHQSFVKKAKSIVTPQILAMEKDERAVNRVMFNSIPFINEKTKKVIPTNWVEHSTFKVRRVRHYFSDGDHQYLDMLHHRKYTLNSHGVTVKLKNAGNMKEILLIEDTTAYGEFYVAYRVTFSNGKQTCGHFCPNMETYFSGFEQDMNEDSLWSMMLVILEVYSDLTCEFEKKYKRLYALKEVETFDDITLNDTNLYVIYEEYEAPEEPTGTRKSFTQKSHQRKHATRKLANGREASEMAKERARAMGIDLQPGETFVRPYWTGVKNVREEIK